jgi:hypothetical protein
MLAVRFIHIMRRFWWWQPEPSQNPTKLIISILTLGHLPLIYGSRLHFAFTVTLCAVADDNRSELSLAGAGWLLAAGDAAK